jgi:hypothetical protein
MRLVSDQLAFALFQVLFWSLFGVFFFLAINPYHPFLDILLLQTAATVALGFAISSVLGSVHGLLVRRKLSLLTINIATLLNSVILGVAWYALAAWVGGLIDPFEISPVRLPSGALFARTQMPVFPLILLLWGLLYLGVTHVREQQSQKERLLRSETLAHEAQLRMLRYQLNPHFLFNALNSIGSLADEAPDRIQPVVGELSRFLRYSLLDAEQLEVQLGEELRAVKNYLKIEKLRFEEDLDVVIELDPAAAERIVPAFIVLPLVENAIKHGRRTSPIPLQIHIAGRIDGGVLCIEVENTGPWAAPSQSPDSPAGTGTGLANVRQRLLAHYPGRHQLEVDEEAGWVHVRIRIDDEN